MSIFQELKRYCQYKQVCYDPKNRGEECTCSYDAAYRKSFKDLPKCEEGNCPFIKILEKEPESLTTNKICKCYEDVDTYFGRGRCLGTKEIDPCACGGDESKCDFYPEKREKTEEPRNDLKEYGEQQQALDKQEKKIVKGNQIMPGVYTTECPSCGTTLQKISGLKPNYCPWCGQHLDWKGLQ